MNEGNDPWAHRSAGMRCQSCMWYAPKLVNGEASSLGRCRRRAPTMNGFPAVFPIDWCGDHKLDESKLGQSTPPANRGFVSELEVLT